MKQFFAFLLLAPVFLGGQSTTVREFSAHELLELIDSERVWLKVGMTKTEVVRVAGKPFNDSRENVWIWSFDQKRFPKPPSWRHYARQGAIFLVFVNGKTIKGIRSTVACSPEEVYSSVFRVDEDQVPAEYRGIDP